MPNLQILETQLLRLQHSLHQIWSRSSAHSRTEPPGMKQKRHTGFFDAEVKNPLTMKVPSLRLPVVARTLRIEARSQAYMSVP